jgi:hypothetical protein
MNRVFTATAFLLLPMWAGALFLEAAADTVGRYSYEGDQPCYEAAFAFRAGGTELAADDQPTFDALVAMSHSIAGAINLIVYTIPSSDQRTLYWDRVDALKDRLVAAGIEPARIAAQNYGGELSELAGLGATNPVTEGIVARLYQPGWSHRVIRSHFCEWQIR